jgi:hypothetical protein
MGEEKKKYKTEDAWKLLFEKHQILEAIEQNGYFEISADQIRKFREPRLMTKFDHSDSRPKIFKKNKLSILPIDNGLYVIGKFNLYKSIPKDTDDSTPTVLNIPNYLESIDPENIYSESNALNVALLSGMIEDLIGEDLFETISGRMRSTGFTFSVKGNKENHSIDVKRPQIEVDGGYEGKNKIVVIEAKNSHPKDFIIRQLYYPYRFWKMKVHKDVVPVFFTYKNGKYTFYIYKFMNDSDYNSIKLVETKTYVIEYQDKDILKFKDIAIVEEPDVPFPQADTFNRVKEVMTAITNGATKTIALAELYEIAPRQGNYYMAAAKYLGLVEKKKDYDLTDLGSKIFDSDFKKKNYYLTKLILSHGPFNSAYKYYMINGIIPPKEIVINYMRDFNIDMNYNDNVLDRRAMTIRGWIRWIINSSVEIV